MRDFVRIRKHGKFYAAYEEDAYVIHAIIGYKVSNGKIGFPENALGKVLQELEEHKVSYLVIENDKETEKKNFPKSNYDKFLKEGKRSFEDIKKEGELVKKIKNLSPEKLEKIVKYIEEVCNEG